MLNYSDEYVSKQNYASYPVSEVGDECIYAQKRPVYDAYDIPCMSILCEVIDMHGRALEYHMQYAVLYYGKLVIKSSTFCSKIQFIRATV